MMEKNIHTFIACDHAYEDSAIVLFGAPFDSTTSYRPGTRFASSAVRNDSFGLETYSPYLNRDLTEIQVYDGGDLELPFGSPQQALEDIEAYTKRVLQDKKLPLMIGGEHLVTLGAVRAVSAVYPDLHILHFDAHADLRDEYLGVMLSHATVMHRCWELVGNGRIFQFGIRSGDKSEFVWGAEHVSTCKFTFETLEETIQKLKGKPIYLTVDLDVLDPSVFPGTGTPEAGGVSFEELRRAIEMVGKHCTVVAADMNELSPIYDQSGASTAVACKILREMLLSLHK